jgi:uncharacterized protein DUF4349
MPAIPSPLPFFKDRRLILSLISFAALFVIALSIPNFLRLRREVRLRDLAPYAEVAPSARSEAQPRSGDYGSIGTLSASERSAAPSPSMAGAFDRKVIRTGTLDLEVKTPAEAMENIRLLAERLGGYLVSSQINGTQYMPSASITIRVPVARFDEARSEIKKLATRLETEKTDQTDVTKDYVDQDARLRNLRATEAQYLSILKRATTVKDTLAVSEKLNEVRGEIEQQQAEFDTLSKQIETVAINIALRAQADTRVFGLQWRPWYQLKTAARDGLDGLGDYAATMTAIIMYLPAILLWMATILVAAVVAWRLLRWVARVFFAFPKPVAADKAS